MKPKETIAQFDRFLAERGLGLDAVVIGGVAMVLLDVASRQTRDCDVLDPRIPPEVADAARDFAVAVRARGEALGDDWFNNGPASLADLLPGGWRKRVQTLFEGAALTLRGLGRADLLKSKLFALCDRGLDLSDCIALAPTPEELEEVLRWLIRQDLHPGWPDHVRDTLADLRKRFRHAV